MRRRQPRLRRRVPARNRNRNRGIPGREARQRFRAHRAPVGAQSAYQLVRVRVNPRDGVKVSVKVNPRRTSSFIRIGKKTSPVETEGDKMSDDFSRLGRASAFVRIGRGRATGTDATKRASSFVRIGKSTKPEELSDTASRDDRSNRLSHV